MEKTSIDIPAGTSERDLNELLVAAIEKTIYKKYQHREDKYNNAFQELYELYNADDDINELMNIGIYNEIDIYKRVADFKYPQHFLDLVKYFIRYELALDENAQEEYVEWEQNQQSHIPPNINC